MWRQIELETLIEHIGNVKHYLGEWKTKLDKEKEKEKKPLQMQWQANLQRWIIQRTTLPTFQCQLNWENFNF